MSVQLQDRFPDPVIAPGLMTNGGSSPFEFSSQWPQNFDAVSRLQNPFSMQPENANGWSSSSSGLPSIVTQLLSVIAQLVSQMGNGMGNWLNGSSGNNQQFFTSASGGSDGDPHLSFNGNTWNDMQSEADLLHSDSIPGGFRISTQTTTPNANGITYNEQATVTTGYGNTQVTLDKTGNATYTQNGITNTLASGQTINLGYGESATRNQDGSLTIVNTSPNGGQITTKMSENGNGVDVNVTASNVDLGGALVNGQNRPTQRLQ